MPLTETAIRRMPDPAKEKLIGDERGLYLRCYPSGKRSWLFRTRVGGSWKTRNLGEWPAVSLSEARAKASTLAGKVLPESVTFGDLLDEWFKRRIEPRYKITKNVETYISRGKRWAGTDRLAKLTAARLVSLLSDYAEASPVAANRCLSNWKLALDYAVERGYLERNPLERTTTRAVGGEERSRDRTLSDDELRALWHLEHSHAPLLRFLLLTGCRINEAMRARHDDIDGDIMRVPENKSSRPHWVYLTDAARNQINPGGWLFHTRNQNAITARLQRAGIGWRPHDLRRTFASRIADMGVPPHIVSRLLNHALPGMLAIYNRADYERERIEATQAWADELQRIAK